MLIYAIIAISSSLDITTSSVLYHTQNKYSHQNGSYAHKCNYSIMSITLHNNTNSSWSIQHNLNVLCLNTCNKTCLYSKNILQKTVSWKKQESIYLTMLHLCHIMHVCYTEIFLVSFILFAIFLSKSYKIIFLQNLFIT